MWRWPSKHQEGSRQAFWPHFAPSQLLLCLGRQSILHYLRRHFSQAGWVRILLGLGLPRKDGLVGAGCLRFALSGSCLAFLLMHQCICLLRVAELLPAPPWLGWRNGCLAVVLDY